MVTLSRRRSACAVLLLLCSCESEEQRLERLMWAEQDRICIQACGSFAETFGHPIKTVCMKEMAYSSSCDGIIPICNCKDYVK